MDVVDTQMCINCKNNELIRSSYHDMGDFLAHIRKPLQKDVYRRTIEILQ